MKKIKAYKCEYCAKSFGEKQNLKRHLKSIHENENRKDFSCSVCNKKFYYNSNLKNHTQEFHMKVKFKATKIEASTKVQPVEPISDTNFDTNVQKLDISIVKNCEQ